ISAQGFEWKATSETTWNNVTATLIGNAITHSLTDLTPNTAYEFKAYAITESGTINGAIESFTTLGLEDAEENSISLTIYPNPATNETRLIVIGVSGQTKIVLSDVQGRILNTIGTKAVNGVVEQTIDVNNLAKGVYYVRIQNSNLNRTNKLIVK
ncbi:MAG: T9SS type A sorting domain-containing protein, partial [Bacteroidales bacterium]|nr:T9SS type A sorting domain-containing protein [Bacteroidales bacterium]